MEGEISVADDGAFVRVQGNGGWTVTYVDCHFSTLNNLLVKKRRLTGGGVRVLVNLGQAAVQPAETAARLQYWTAHIYGPGDRVAIVVVSQLLKVQMRRVASIADRELFLSEPPARDWLTL